MAESHILIGEIVGPHGVRGWVKVVSYTRPREAILKYNPWWIAGSGEWRPRELVAGRVHGKGIIAQLAGCSDRDGAGALLGARIALQADQLPPPKPGEYYWRQLEGLKVADMSGRELGTVSHLIETGANDVLVVRGGVREHLIPAIASVIREVRFDAGLVRVDWEAED